MTDFVYSTVPGKIKVFFEKIREVRVPTKATNTWLKSIGFKSSNDRSLISVLKFIGFANDDGTPTEKWIDFRGKEHKTVIANAIVSSYDELFQTYQDANNRSSQELVDFFRTKTSSGDQVVRKTVSTFQSLCELANFSNLDREGIKSRQQSDVLKKAPEQKAQKEGGNQYSIDPSVHIDIQIHIPPDASTEQIEAIFMNMSKYLFERNKNI